VLDLVAHDKAGERILEGLLTDADRRLREHGIAGDIYLFKNNTDSAGNSYGCHENYLVDRHGDFERLTNILTPFLVTRQIICGAGKVLPTPPGATYCLSQRADHIWDVASSASTGSRAVIDTEDKPYADAARFRRLRVTAGDSNMSETTTLLKVGATDLVLRMIEAGTIMPDLTLDNPIRAIREVSHDMTGRSRVWLASGCQMSALQIQYEYLTRARDFTGSNGLSVAQIRWHRTDACRPVSRADLPCSKGAATGVPPSERGPWPSGEPSWRPGQHLLDDDRLAVRCRPRPWWWWHRPGSGAPA
jgi:proteasome accessory factor A